MLLYFKHATRTQTSRHQFHKVCTFCANKTLLYIGHLDTFEANIMKKHKTGFSIICNHARTAQISRA